MPPSQDHPVRLPTRLFETQRKMDDYRAADMQYGDLTQSCLENYYNLKDISKRINPFTHPHREESARILFDEFRQLSDTFSFVGPYQGLIRRLIDHMQYGNGEKFTDPLLDRALAEHSSMENSLNIIRETIVSKTNWLQGYFPRDNFNSFNTAIMSSVLPKFNKPLDRINGLVISVHDTWSTHITLESLELDGDKYRARIYYRIQDHFGLDDTDILDWLYKQFRIFRIWFTLQHWEGFSFQPFITEINVTQTIEGSRFDKI